MIFDYSNHQSRPEASWNSFNVDVNEIVQINALHKFHFALASRQVHFI